MWDTVLVAACGMVSAVAMFLAFKVNHLQNQQNEMIEVLRETIHSGIKMTVQIGAGGAAAKEGGKGAQKKRRRTRSSLLHPDARDEKGDAVVAKVRRVTSKIMMEKRTHALPVREEWNNPNFTIRLTFASETSAGSPFIVYVVNAQHENGSVVAQKRFAQFRRLNRDVAVRWTGDPLPNLPMIKVKDVHDESELETSKSQLQDYLNGLPKEVFNWPEVQHFFETGFSNEDTGSAGELSEPETIATVSVLDMDKSVDEEVTPEDDDEEFDERPEEDDDFEVPDIPEGLNCLNLKNDSSVMYIANYEYLNDGNKIRALSQGKTFFTFAFHSGSSLTNREKLLCDSILNLTSFEDETRDNEMPYIDVYDKEVAATFTVAIVKNGYMIPGVSIDMVTPELICSQEYLHACMPGSPKIWKQVPDNTTFRITKTIVPWIFSMTLQFKCSVVDKKHYPALSRLDNCPVHHAILLERTKRDKTARDATLKAKAILLYTVVPGGLFMRNATVSLNSWVPSFVIPFIDTCGSLGSKETKETATMTRAYFKKLLKKAGKA